jgi:hypothetical protein
MSDRVRYGLYLPPFGPFGDPVVLVDLTVRAEAAGWDGIAVAGNASPAWAEPATVDLGALAQADMIWWMESLIHFDPLDLSLRIVDAGPPR